MKISDMALISMESLRERKFRFALNLIGILIGCAAITGLVSITQGMKNEVTDQLEMFGPNNIFVIPGQVQPGRGVVGSTFSWRDLEIVRKIRYVEIATPIIGNKFGEIDVRGKRYSPYVFGVYPEYFTIFKSLKISEGRPLLRADSAVAVIGAAVAKPRDEDEPIIDVGDRIRLRVRVEGEDREMMFRVVGVMEEVGGTFGSD
ncbi:MAG: ABC transporter permease, partial [Candidatus Bathyarchaeia archaeon]